VRGTVTSIALAGTDPAGIKADAVVIGVLKKGDGIRLAPGAAPVEARYGRALRKVLTNLGATGAPLQVTKLPSSGKVAAPLVVAVGLGDDEPDTELLRKAAGSAVRSLAGSSRVVLALPADEIDSMRAVAEGAMFGAYAFNGYRKSSAGAHKAPVGSITIATGIAKQSAATKAVTEVKAVSRGLHLTRDLINTPPSDLTPKTFAEAAVAACKSLKLDVKVLDQAALARGKYGGILAVGQGSVNPPRLVQVSYRHPKATKHLALIGKGITFDSGGISIKPAPNMDWMKSDMSGAAAVLGAMTAIARLKPTTNVTGWMPLAENMPSGSAQRPSDVITIRGGRTVEVLNTDAEGRLVLADAIVRAGEDSPDVIVDVATLTGAALVALGSRTAGIMANDDELRTQLHTLATDVGEQMWPMPLPAELRSSMDSPIADIANIGGRFGGMMTAGLFLKEFVPDNTPWAHIDIAGPAYNTEEGFGYTPKGGTGSAVRTFVALAVEFGS
jgi:leucyl aminopeptidase